MSASTVQLTDFCYIEIIYDGMFIILEKVVILVS